MRALVLLALVGCEAPRPRPNLAAAYVRSVAPVVKCEPYYTDEGPAHLHSAVCTIDGAPAYCSVSIDKAPNCVATTKAAEKKP